MELTYRQLLEAKPILVDILQLRPALTARLGALVARNLRHIDNTLKDFEKARLILIDEYADPATKKLDEEKLPPEKKAALDAEYQELLETVVEVPIHTMKLSDIESLEQNKTNFSFPAGAFFAAEWMFEGLP